MQKLKRRIHFHKNQAKIYEHGISTGYIANYHRQLARHYQNQLEKWKNNSHKAYCEIPIDKNKKD